MKRLCTVLSSLLLCIAAVPAARAADTLEEVKKNGVLAVGVRDATPPMSFLDREKGQVVGIEVDLAGAVAKKIGVPLRLVPVTAAGRVEALRSGKVDLVAASFSKTPDRAKLVDFSLTYFNAKQRVLAKKGVVSTLKDLEGKRIAVVGGTTTEKNLREKVTSATVLPLGDMREVVGALSRAEVDVVSGDGVTLYGYFLAAPKEKKDLFEIPPGIDIADENYGMAVRKGDGKFLDFVNGALAELKESGEAERIFSKWLRGAPTPEDAALAEYRARADQAHRRKRQEAHEKARTHYDYEYDDSYWWGVGAWGVGWAGYYRW